MTGENQRGGPVLQPRLLALLVCPRCGSALADGGGADPGAGDPGPAGGDTGLAGDVVCGRGHRFPVTRGYLDLSGEAAPDSTTARTFESFGYEWNAFDDVRDEDAGFAEVYFRDLDLSSLAGGTGLDAGCGKGRYTRFVAPHLAALVALDGSSAVEAAARNLAPFDNVVVVRSDLRRAPVAPGSLDLVLSLGVLHHLEDPRAGFASLVRLLAPGGRILVYLYGRPARAGLRAGALAAAAQLRRVTVRLPHRLLRVLSAPVALALWVGVVGLGSAGERLGIGPLARLPMASYRGTPLRSLMLDTFDRLSAPVEHRYVWEDLAPWFAAEGLVVEAARDETGWFVLARRPTT
ncbi:MAG TPA: class I SAM-dependent methyltransferase [Acidimicrobiales bacterium]|nr:class I SAM-dependent methyltransferase [Acidimicrobiales bacterium]